MEKFITRSGPETKKKKGNLVIRWIPLKRIYHNAPLLMYRVYFACNGERKHVYTVNDWRVGRMVYPGQSKLHNCEVVVTTLNSIGNSDADPEKVMSENVPYGTNSLRPLKHIPPQNITEPSPNGILGEILPLANLSPDLRQIRRIKTNSRFIRK
ncbi:unnamed protein product [Brassicogethes aeneus]|uniref:Uncharacterized protein n=1 Tax=Brassicogethes aeneus TaxID=1431903 RepID=A0A9P0AWC8_BRAAE|nr:unnamed protein product [Brassicogethes aeneus]